MARLYSSSNTYDSPELQHIFAEYIRSKYPNYHNWSIKIDETKDKERDTRSYTIRLVNPEGAVFSNTFTVSNDLLKSSDTSVIVYMIEKAMAEIFDFNEQKGIAHLNGLLNMLL